MENYFTELSLIDVSKQVEQKDQFNYLSWPYAVSQLRQYDPTATWEVIRFNGSPYLETPYGYFVEVAVTVKGYRATQIHPILDSKNQAVVSADYREKLPQSRKDKYGKIIPITYTLLTSMLVNTSIQRCLVKCIALHGLGLNVYAGEDLPLLEEGTMGSESTNGSREDHLLEEALGALAAVKSLDELKQVYYDAYAKIRDPERRKKLVEQKDVIKHWLEKEGE